MQPLQDWFRGLGVVPWGQQQGPEGECSGYCSSTMSAWSRAEIHWPSPPFHPTTLPAATRIHQEVHPTEGWLVYTTHHSLFTYAISMSQHGNAMCNFTLTLCMRWMWVAELACYFQGHMNLIPGSRARGRFILYSRLELTESFCHSLRMRILILWCRLRSVEKVPGWGFASVSLLRASLSRWSALGLGLTLWGWKQDGKGGMGNWSWKKAANCPKASIPPRESKMEQSDWYTRWHQIKSLTARWSALC